MLLSQDAYQKRYKERLKRIQEFVLPLMDKHGVRAWYLEAGDFREDPILTTLITEASPARTRLLFIKHKDFVTWGSLSQAGSLRNPPPFEGLLAPGEKPMEGLKRLLQAGQVDQVVVNVHREFPQLDGLSHQSYLDLEEEKIPMTQNEDFLIAVMSSLLDEEVDTLKEALALGDKLVRRAMSREVITPGLTTTNQVAYWMRKEMLAHQVDCTWGPNVDLQRKGITNPLYGQWQEGCVIEEGDLVHIDFSLRKDGLETDRQLLAYVGNDLPSFFKEGFEEVKWVEKVFMEEIKPGRRGDQVLQEVLRRTQEAGLKATIYSHPIGYQTHGVGPAIGRYQDQESVPYHGGLEIKEKMVFAMELNIRKYYEAWDQEVYFFVEEDIIVTDQGHLLGPDQKVMWSI